jgi:hypothetical protein
MESAPMQAINTVLVFVFVCVAVVTGYFYAEHGRQSQDAAVRQCVSRLVDAGSYTDQSEKICRAAVQSNAFQLRR